MRKKRRTVYCSVCIMVVLLMALFALSCTKGKSKLDENAVKLEQGFLVPPETAKIRVWWRWMNGNITKEGIRADLEWMKRAGIGGFQNFDAGLATPPVVENRLVYMTPEWKDTFLFTAQLADSLGLEMAIAGGAQGMFQRAGSRRYLEASSDGKEFRKVTDIPPGALAQKTLSFQAVTGKYFRFAWEKLPATAGSTGLKKKRLSWRLPICTTHSLRQSMRPTW